MQCPKCREKLRKAQYQTHDYMACFYCEGVWLGRSVLEGYARQPVSALCSLTRPLRLECPDCGELLHEGRMSGPGQHVTVECCVSCEGIFFDRGELEKTLPGLKQTDLSQVSSDAARAAWSVMGLVSVLLSALRG